MWKLCFIWGISQSPGDQFAERMLFLMVVTLVWIQLQIHLGKKKNQELLTLHPSQKKIVFTEKKKHSKDRGLRLPCQNQETVSHMQLQKGNHWWLLQIYPQQCPTAGHCPPWSLGCFPRKNGSVNQLDEMWWFYKSLHGNLRAPPPQCQPPPRRKIRPC